MIFASRKDAEEYATNFRAKCPTWTIKVVRIVITDIDKHIESDIFWYPDKNVPSKIIQEGTVGYLVAFDSRGKSITVPDLSAMEEQLAVNVEKVL